jgi:hypothetical protein
MEVKEEIEHCHIYQFCPPWALEGFRGRRVSLMGRVHEKID